MNTWTHSLLNRLKVGRNTNAAKRLLREFASVATNKRNNMIYSGYATETQLQIQKQSSIIINSESSDEDKQEAYRTIQNIFGITGTFRDDKGKYHQGGYNKAQAYAQLGTFAKNNLNFDTVEEYKDFLESIKVSGTDQYMYERHTAHYNKLVKEYESHLIQDTEHKTKVAKLKDKRKVLDANQKLIEMSKGKKDDPDLMGEVYVEWYEKHVKNLSKEQQRKLLTQLGDFSEKDIDVLPVFITIQEELTKPNPNKSAIMQMAGRLARKDKSKFLRLTDLLGKNPALKALDSDVNLDPDQIKKNITQLLRTNIKSLAYPQGEDELNNPEYIRVNEELIADYFEVLDINLSQYDKGKITQEQLDKAKKEAWDYVITSFNNGHPDQKENNPELYYASKYRRELDENYRLKFTTFGNTLGFEHGQGWLGSNLAILNLRDITHETFKDPVKYNLFHKVVEQKIEKGAGNEAINKLLSNPNILSPAQIDALNSWNTERSESLAELNKYDAETQRKILDGNPPAGRDTDGRILNGIKKLPPIPEEIKKLIDLVSPDQKFNILNTLAETVNSKHSLYFPVGEQDANSLKPNCPVWDRRFPNDNIGVAAICSINGATGVIPKSNTLDLALGLGEISWDEFEVYAKTLNAFGVPTTPGEQISSNQIKTAINNGILYVLTPGETSEFMKNYGSVFSQGGN